MGIRTMGIIFLWLNRLGIAALDLLPAVASAEEVRCPAANAGAQLATVVLFDGPPSEHADLMPDRYRKGKSGGQSDWNVTYIFKAGRHLFVECQYGAKIPSIVLEATAAGLCTFSTNNDAGNSLTGR